MEWNNKYKIYRDAYVKCVCYKNVLKQRKAYKNQSNVYAKMEWYRYIQVKYIKTREMIIEIGWKREMIYIIHVMHG